MGDDRDAALLAQELQQLGLATSAPELEALLFVARRRWNRFDLFADGETFEGRLPRWLMNFEIADRPAAFELVKSLSFVSYRELRRLAACAFQLCEDIVSGSGPSTKGIPWNALLDVARESGQEAMSRTLFMAASDDVLFDFFRRIAQRSIERLVRDNFVEYYKLDGREREGLPPHHTVVLLDQFCGSGTSSIRKEGERWRGKLPTFARLWPEEAASCRIVYMPYLITSVASANVRARLAEWRHGSGGPEVLVAGVQTLSVSPCLATTDGSQVNEKLPVALLCSKYYDKFVPDQHIAKGGSAVYGYGGAGLTLVLNTNVPNNTVPLIWHADNGWFPLFPRVEHHREKA